ncbi:MAG: exopolysaccharide biosynthesis polyprenyl glycosylphosphotransferase [Candidatus Paceibacterota bacterium]
MSLRFKKIILFLGDIAIFFASLLLVISIRYPEKIFEEFSIHLLPFSFFLPLWLSILYISNLYEQKILKNNAEFFKTLFLSLVVWAIISIIFFYFIPFFGISPKTNLFLLLLFMFIFETLWRRIFNSIVYYQSYLNILLIGSSETSQKIYDFLRNNRQLGYRVKEWLNAEEMKNSENSIEKILSENKIDAIILPESSKKHLSKISALYKRLNLNLDVENTSDFYEKIFQKVPLSEIEDIWFLDNLAKRRKAYDSIKRLGEIIFSLFLLVLLSPLFLFIFLLLKIFSPGPALYSQTRVGRNEKEFTLYKFRSMKKDAEKNGPEWAKQKDSRQTRIGSFLRKTHLDELPQLWNIFLGDISFVGPRPERPEFVKNLKEIIPFYETRHILKPGVTGWAQINYRYGSSIEDAYEKLEYDLFYIKHRSLGKDLSIIIKTIKTLFATPE